MSDTTGLMPIPAGAPAELVKFLTSANEYLATPQEDAELNIIAELLTAPDAAGVLSQADVEHMGDYVNKDVTIASWQWRSSDKSEGPGVYMMLTITTPDNLTPRLVSTGSKSIMAQVFRLSELGLLPVEVTVWKSPTPTKGGNFPMRLLMPEQPFGAADQTA